MVKDSDEPESVETKLSPDVPDSVLKMWFVDIKCNYEVKKISENPTAKAYISWNSKVHILQDSVGKQIKVYKSFKEAVLQSLHLKFQDKKKKWDAYVKASMLLNDEITDIIDQIHKLEGDEDEET